MPSPVPSLRRSTDGHRGAQCSSSPPRAGCWGRTAPHPQSSGCPWSPRCARHIWPCTVGAGSGPQAGLCRPPAHRPRWLLTSPRTTRTSPTAARRPGCGMACAPRAARPRQPRTGHCIQSCRSQGTASSSSAQCGTGSPRRRCVSTHSSCWSPTWVGSGMAASAPATRDHLAPHPRHPHPDRGQRARSGAWASSEASTGLWGPT